MSAKSPSDLTINQLKEKLRELGLSLTGSKAELIARLNGADPSSKWAEEISAVPEASATIQGDQGDPEDRTPILIPHYERELEMYRREKELAERELQLARREIELLREMQRLNTERNQTTRRESTSHDVPKTSITAIAELLGYFDGNTGDFEIWEKQLKLLKATYHLSDEYIRILIGMRLKGNASNWLHSKSQHIELPVNTLLDEMREMYNHRPSRMRLRKQFEERVWKREETFHQYVHEKVILANRVSIGKDDIIDYIIEGIPVASLRDQAHIGKFTTQASLLQAFEKVTLKDKVTTGGTKKEEQQKQGYGAQRQRGGEKTEKRSTTKSETEKRCFNCGQRNHVSVDCPTKEEGPKCFQCGERGHIASRCQNAAKGQNAVRSIQANMHTVCKKYNKEVEINGRKVLALIDTGSDISLLRSDKYIQLGSPLLIRKEIQFRGIGSSDNSTMGEFNANLTIDANSYSILIRVVSDAVLKYEAIIGTDFLDKIEMTIKAGEISINPLLDSSCVDKNMPEIYQIDLNSEEHDEIDVSHIPDIEYKNQIKELITNYNPNKSREVDLRMTIVLKDETPVYQRARRLAASEREQVNTQINDWLRDGIIQPSLSEYASPVVLAKKKDNSVRLCIDC